MRRLFLLLVCLSLPLIAWAVANPDLVAQALAKKTHGDLKGALADYSLAIAQNPQDVAAYLGRASAYSSEGNYTAALADNNKAIALDPKNAAAYSNRGNVRMMQGNLDGAIADYTTAIKLDPHHVRALINRGNVKNLQKEYGAAHEDYSAAIALDPQNAVAYYNRAGAKRSLGDYEGARTDYAKAIELNPTDAQAYIDLGVLEMARKNWNVATTDLNKAADLTPNLRQAYIQAYLWVIAVREKIDDPFGRAKNLGSDPAQAANNLAHVIATTPNTYFSTWGWQIVHFLAGQTSEKSFLNAAQAAQAEKNKSQLAKAYYFAGVKREIAGDKAGAAKLFKQCVAAGDPSLHEYILAKEELRPTKVPFY